MTSQTIIAASLALIAGLAVPARADTLTLDELAALDKQQAWHELFEHLDDVPPSKRNDRWSELVEHAAFGVLDGFQGHTEGAFVFGDVVLKRYASLKKSKRFMDLRGQVGKSGLEQCLEQGGEMGCVDHAVSFVDGDPGNAELAWVFARSIGKLDPSAAVRVLRRALAGSHTAKQCGDDLVKHGVVHAFALAASDVRVGDAKAITVDLCWDQVKEAVVDGFIDGTKQYRLNTCELLLAKKDALSAMSRRQCEELLKP